MIKEDNDNDMTFSLWWLNFNKNILLLRIAETSVPGVFQLELERLAKCGVRTNNMGKKPLVVFRQNVGSKLSFWSLWDENYVFSVKSGEKNSTREKDAVGFKLFLLARFQ